MKLYGLRGACSLAPLIARYEAGVQIDYQQLARGQQHEAWYTAINPAAKVPALLLDNGEVLTETAAILQFIADRSTDLLPPVGSDARYQVLSWCNTLATSVHGAVNRMFYSEQFGTSDHAGLKAAAIAELDEHFTRYAKHFDNHEYAVGDHFSIADIYSLVVIRWGRYLPLEQATNQHPALRVYCDRLCARPAVQFALVVEGIKDFWAL